MPSVVTARFSGKLALNNKDVEVSLTAIPEPIPGMIQSAVLKKYSAPLVIENIQAPKNLKPNEVSL